MQQLLTQPVVANSAYGVIADAWARRLPPDFPIISADLPAAALAFVDAAARRKRGIPFAATLFADDSRTAVALAYGAPQLLRLIDHDQRRGMLDAVSMRRCSFDGKEQAALEQIDARYTRTALEFLTTADTVVFRSQAEQRRIIGLVRRLFPYSSTVAPLDPSVPAPSGSRTRDAIVVWAPQLAAPLAALFAFGLEEFRRPTFIICGDGAIAPMRESTRFINVSEAAAALSRAAMIIDGSLYDPGVTRALARYNVPIAASITSGAEEWLDGIVIYEPWNFRSISNAAADALGGCAPRERAGTETLQTLEAGLLAAAPPEVPNAPLVSVVVPTLNRNTTLRAAVESIEAQTYSKLEIIVVNDGGPPLGAALADCPRVTVVDQPENRGVSEAVNAGIAAAHGKYIGLLADDDVFCPDHLTQLVGALERSNGHMAHGIELAEHYEREADGTLSLIGHSLIAGEPAYPSMLQVCNVIGGPSIVFSRAAYERTGPFDPRAGHLMDLEMWMRMSQHYEVIHVNRVTTIMTMRNDRTQASSISGAETAERYRTIYALNPSPRSAITQFREQQVNDIAQMPLVQTLPQLRLR